MRRLNFIYWVLKKFDLKSILISFMILFKRKLKIPNFSKNHLIKFNYQGKILKFWIKENDGVFVLMDTFGLKIYDNKICKNNKIIFDCGAHIGTSAIFFSLLNPKAKIYCFEPDKSSFELLKKNLKLNNINSEVYNYAISDKNCFVNFASNLNCSVASKIEEGGKSKVQSKNLDTLMQELKIDKLDLLKLDIEGEELNVLKKLTNSTKIKNLVCEIHKQFYSLDKLKEIIKEKGFKIHPDLKKKNSILFLFQGHNS